MNKFVKTALATLFAVTIQCQAQDKLSGELTVYMPSPAKLADKLASEFQKDTGVEVKVFQGTTGEILARLEAEKANPVADVVILASWSDGLLLKEQGVLESYDLPAKDKVVEGFIDNDNELFGSSASAVGIIYNKTIVDNLNADWDELATDKYKDMTAMPDPEKSGACKDFLAGFVAQKGMKTLENLAKNGMIIPGANKAALEAVTTGEVAILVAGVDYNAYSSMKKGEPLGFYYPPGGTIINPRPAMILKSAPDKENAKAFVNFLFSDKAQNLVKDAYLIPGRVDIKTDKRSNLEDIPTIKADWEKMTKIASKTAATVNKLCK